MTSYALPPLMHAPAGVLPSALLPSAGSSASIVQQAADVTAAAKKWNIDPTLLWGVYGVETDYGSNIKTSSAGAIGAFQFEPATAAHYGYPLTNNPSADDFKRQADAAAHYLHDLGATAGAPEAAVIKALGGYGGGSGAVYFEKLKAALKRQPGAGSGVPLIGGAIDAVTGAAQDAAGAASDAAAGVGKFFSLLASLEFWLRLGEGIAGLVLIALGLKGLTGFTIPTPPIGITV